jgi:hypothetical protein
VDTPNVDKGAHALYSQYHELYQRLYERLEPEFDAAAKLVTQVES